MYNDALAQCDTDGEATLLDPTMAQERFWLLVCNDPDPDAGIDIEFARFLCELGEVAHTPDEMRCIPAGYSSRYDEDIFPTIERTDLHPTTGALHSVTYRSLASVLAEYRDMVARYDAYHARTQALTT